jgi:hypothetical protein
MLLMAPMRNRLCGPGSATFLTLLLAGLLGCSTSGSGATTPIPGTTTALASQLAEAFCAAQSACCGAPAGTTTPDGSTNRDGGAATGAGSCTTGSNVAATDGGPSTCLERATLAANQQLALVTTAFGEGLLTIDPTIATNCVSAYGSSSCASLAGQTEPNVQAALDNPACANLFTGYIPVGERCDMSEECVSDAYCLSQGTGQNVTSIAGSGTLGTCFLFQGMGGACNTTEDCLPPLACNATTLTCE